MSLDPSHAPRTLRNDGNDHRAFALNPPFLAATAYYDYTDLRQIKRDLITAP